jgi:hypothetical protein
MQEVMYVGVVESGIDLLPALKKSKSSPEASAASASDITFGYDAPIARAGGLSDSLCGMWPGWKPPQASPKMTD